MWMNFLMKIHNDKNRKNKLETSNMFTTIYSRYNIGNITTSDGHSHSLKNFFIPNNISIFVIHQ